jgi:hypothetical protein
MFTISLSDICGTEPALRTSSASTIDNGSESDLERQVVELWSIPSKASYGLFSEFDREGQSHHVSACAKLALCVAPSCPFTCSRIDVATISSGFSFRALICIRNAIFHFHILHCRRFRISFTFQHQSLVSCKTRLIHCRESHIRSMVSIVFFSPWYSVLNEFFFCFRFCCTHQWQSIGAVSFVPIIPVYGICRTPRFDQACGILSFILKAFACL